MASEKVIVDTSAFFALVSDRDEFHPKAKLAYVQLIDEGVELYTSSYIFAETAALIHHRLGYSILDSFVESIKDSMSILWASKRMHWDAWDLLKERGGQRLSFVDCTTMILAKRLEAHVFTFDQDFQQAGFKTIPY